MASIIETIAAANERGMRVRPKVGGFPYLAESLRAAGVRQYVFDVPSMSVVFSTDDGAVLQPGRLLVSEPTVVPAFDADALIAALRVDQAGESTFPEFVAAAFAAGVVRFVVDTTERTCTYFSPTGDSYVEAYPAVELPAS